MLEHLGVSRQQLLLGQSVEKSGGYHRSERLAERTQLVFAAVEVDAGLAAHRSIDGSEQSRGHVYHTHTALEGDGGKSANVGHHTAAHAYDDVGASGAGVVQRAPDSLERVEVFVDVAAFYGDDGSVCHGLALGGEHGQHVLGGVDVDKHEGARSTGLGYESVDGIADEVGKYQFLVHNVKSFFIL